MSENQDKKPDHEKARFDRSERLWGAEAQKLLRTGHAVLLGATPVGCETMKNLVLPGLGFWTVVDNQAVTKRDLGTNFFLEQADLGKNRAEATVAVLQELNDLTRGVADTRSIQAVVDDVAFFQGKNLVVASSDVTRSQLIALGNLLKGKGVPIVHATANGMFGTIRIQADDQFVIHAHPGMDTIVHDLRAMQPFPALKAFFDRYDPRDKSLTVRDYAHLPWFLVVNWALREWQKQNNHGADVFPKGGAQWRQLHPIILSWTRIYSRQDAGQHDQNADEATAAEQQMAREQLPDSFLDARDNSGVGLEIYNRNFPELKEILTHSKCQNPSKGDHDFWFLAHGLMKWREANGNLMPISGTIPDFTATTEMYRELQAIFKAEALQNAKDIHAFTTAALKAAGRAETEIPFEDAQVFAAHAWELRHVTYPTFEQEHTPSEVFPIATDGSKKWTNTGLEAFKWFIAHRAALLFRDKKGRHPGAASTVAEITASTDGDLAEMKTLCKEIMVDGSNVDELEPYLKEWIRGGGGEIVTISSIIGATASQECIKLIQRHRVPMTHTLLFDGIENFYTTIGMGL